MNFFDDGIGFRGVVGPTVNFALNRNLGNIYAGLALGLDGGGGDTTFIFGFVTGIDYLVTPSVSD